MANEKITVKLGSPEQRATMMNPMMLRPLIWCTACAQLVQMVTLETATIMSRTNVEKLNQRVENHSLHSIRVRSGSVLICLPSLTEKSAARSEILRQNSLL
jgi:hypothetical protein